MAHVNVPELVEEVLETYDLTQAQLGELVGRDQTTVSGWKRGTYVPDELILHILTCESCREHFFEKRRG